MDKILGNIIDDQHKENQMSESAEQEDFVDVLLGLQQSGTLEFSINHNQQYRGRRFG
jgi:hypothetical protein